MRVNQHYLQMVKMMYYKSYLFIWCRCGCKSNSTCCKIAKLRGLQFMSGILYYIYIIYLKKKYLINKMEKYFEHLEHQDWKPVVVNKK